MYRGDIYIKEKDQIEWLGSICLGGYEVDDIYSSTAREFRLNVKEFLNGRDDSIPPVKWPWPWKTSSLTDHVHVFIVEGRKWWEFWKSKDHGRLWTQIDYDGDHNDPDTLNVFGLHKYPNDWSENDERIVLKLPLMKNTA